MTDDSFIGMLLDTIKTLTAELDVLRKAGDEMAETLELGCARNSNDIVDIMHLDLVDAWNKAKETK